MKWITQGGSETLTARFGFIKIVRWADKLTVTIYNNPNQSETLHQADLDIDTGLHHARNLSLLLYKNLLRKEIELINKI